MAFNLTLALSTLITANHILHFQNILDAYGHISMRNPANASTFYLSRDLAPALVSTQADIVEYLVADGTPVLGAAAPKGFSERFIHSEIYKRYPAAQSVIHSHAEDVIPFGGVSSAFHPVSQRGTVLGSTGAAPKWDIANYRLPTDLPTFRVSNTRFGAQLAEAFGPVPSNTSHLPEHRVVLMTGHGMAIQGANVIDAVFVAINTAIAAREQTKAITLAALAGNRGQPVCNGNQCSMIRYLTEEEKGAIVGQILDFEGRGWELWVREVQAAAAGHIYQNALGSPI